MQTQTVAANTATDFKELLFELFSCLIFALTYLFKEPSTLIFSISLVYFSLNIKVLSFQLEA